MSGNGKFRNRLLWSGSSMSCKFENWICRRKGTKNLKGKEEVEVRQVADEDAVRVRDVLAKHLIESRGKLAQLLMCLFAL